MLISDIKTKYVSVALTPVIIGTIVLVHSAKGWLFTNEGGGREFPLFLIIALITQGLPGNGAFFMKSIVSK